jgi:hypothetical protein
LNDTVVILLPRWALEGNGAARDRPADHQLELLLPEEAKHLSADLARIDVFLNDGRFIAVAVRWRSGSGRGGEQPVAPVRPAIDDRAPAADRIGEEHERGIGKLQQLDGLTLAPRSGRRSLLDRHRATSQVRDLRAGHRQADVADRLRSRQVSTPSPVPTTCDMATAAPAVARAVSLLRARGGR